MRPAQAVAAIALSIAVAACGQTTKSSTRSNPSASSAPSEGAQTTTTLAPTTITTLSAPSVSLAWSKFPIAFGETAAYYVARIDNPTGDSVAEALDTYVVDSTGTVVGSSRDIPPLIPPHSQFDMVGTIGVGAQAQLSGVPSSVQFHMVAATGAGAGEPMLSTSELMLTQGSTDTFTNAPLSYDLTVRVTNSTSETVSWGVTQQTVLYDQAGNVVGGDTGSSDNVPSVLPPGMSYRESWTGIPAWQGAARAVYSVWPG